MHRKGRRATGRVARSRRGRRRAAAGESPASSCGAQRQDVVGALGPRDAIAGAAEELDDVAASLGDDVRQTLDEEEGGAPLGWNVLEEAPEHAELEAFDVELRARQAREPVRGHEGRER